MANGLRAGKVPTLHVAHARPATTDLIAEERTPGPLGDGTRPDRTDMTNGRAQSTMDPVVNVEFCRDGPARPCRPVVPCLRNRTQQAAAHLKSLTLRLPGCARAAWSRGRGETRSRAKSEWRLAACATNKTAISVSHSSVAAPKPPHQEAASLRRIAATETSRASQAIASNLASLDGPVAYRRAIARRTQGATAGNTIPGFPNNPTRGRDVELGCVRWAAWQINSCSSVGRRS